MPRIRKEPELVSSPAASAIARVRRESDRLRTDILGSDNGSITGQRNPPAQREVKINQFIYLIFFFLPLKKTKIYRLPQNINSADMPGSLPTETKSLLLSAGNYFHFLLYYW
jgi:hypothetical protein